jgi:hypothetical protein
MRSRDPASRPSQRSHAAEDGPAWGQIHPLIAVEDAACWLFFTLCLVTAIVLLPLVLLLKGDD